MSPGGGEARDRCGEWRARVVCPEHESHHFEKIHTTCYRPECPECNTKWRTRATRGAAAHLRGFEQAYGITRKARHIILSPPQSWCDQVDQAATPDQVLQRLYADTAEILKTYGVNAQVIPHPYRLKDADQDIAQDRAVKKINRYQVVLDLDTWRDQVEVSPHSHCLAYGPLPPFERFHRETGGWIYKVADNSAMKGGNYEIVISYLLSHAWTLGNRKVVRAYGDLSTARLRCTTIKTREPRPCRVCGSALVRLHESDRVYEDGRPRGWVYQDLHHAPRAFRVVIEKRYYKPRRKPPRQIPIA